MQVCADLCRATVRTVRTYVLPHTGIRHPRGTSVRVQRTRYVTIERLSLDHTPLEKPVLRFSVVRSLSGFSSGYGQSLRKGVQRSLCPSWQDPRLGATPVRRHLAPACRSKQCRWRAWAHTGRQWSLGHGGCAESGGTSGRGAVDPYPFLLPLPVSSCCSPASFFTVLGFTAG